MTSLEKIILTRFNREVKYFRSPDFPFRKVPNSLGLLTVPSKEVGRCPYSSSDESTKGGGDESDDKLVPEVETCRQRSVKSRGAALVP